MIYVKLMNTITLDDSPFNMWWDLLSLTGGDTASIHCKCLFECKQNIQQSVKRYDTFFFPPHFPFHFGHVDAVHFQTQNSDFSEAYFKGVSWFEKQE